MRLHLPGPFCIVVKDQRDRGLRWGNVPRIGQFLSNLACLDDSRCFGAVRAQHPCVELLLRKRRLPPAEIADCLCPVGKGLPSPETHHAGQGGRVVRGPIYRAGLLFHHPPATASDRAIEIVVKGLKIWIALPRVAALLLWAGPDPVL